MPIVTEYERDLVHHYSNAGFKIRNTTTGEVYDDAWDLASFNYIYEETDERIDGYEESSESSEDEVDPVSPEQAELELYAQAGRILLGED